MMFLLGDPSSSIFSPKISISKGETLRRSLYHLQVLSGGGDRGFHSSPALLLLPEEGEYHGAAERGLHP